MFIFDFDESEYFATGKNNLSKTKKNILKNILKNIPDKNSKGLKMWW